MKPFRALFALALALLLVGPGCSTSSDSGGATTTTADAERDPDGDDGDGDDEGEEVTLDDWIDGVGSACQDFDDAWSAAGVAVAGDEDVEELQVALEEARSLMDDFATAVAEVERPTDEPDAVDDFFSAVDDIAAAYQEAEAAVGEDPVAVQQAMDDAVKKRLERSQDGGAE